MQIWPYLTDIFMLLEIWDKFNLYFALSSSSSSQSPTAWHALNINYSFSQNPFRKPPICSRNLPTPRGEATWAVSQGRGRCPWDVSVSAPVEILSLASQSGESCSVTTPPAPVRTTRRTTSSHCPSSPPAPARPPPRPPPPRPRAAAPPVRARASPALRCQVITTNLHTKLMVNILMPTGEITDYTAEIIILTLLWAPVTL